MKFYANMIISLAVMLAISITIAGAFLFSTGYLYGQNCILSTDKESRNQLIKAGSAIMDHYADMERNGCFNLRKAKGEK